MMIRVGILLLALGLIGCSPYVPNPVNPDEMEKPCLTAEETLAQLQCRDGQGKLLSDPTLRGDSFEKFCLDSINSGAMSVAEATCLAKLENCDGVELCAEE